MKKNILKLAAMVMTLAPIGALAAPIVLAIAPAVDGDGMSIDSFVTVDQVNTDNGVLLATDNFRSALEFSLTAIPGAATIESATLNLFTTLADLNIGVHGYTGNGTLEDSDFLLTNEITQFDPEPVNVVDVTSFVQSQHTASSQYVGFQLRELVAGETTMFASAEFPDDEDMRPFLEVRFNATAVPEPGTLALLGLGIAGMGFARRKKA